MAPSSTFSGCRSGTLGLPFFWTFEVHYIIELIKSNLFNIFGENPMEIGTLWGLEKLAEFGAPRCRLWTRSQYERPKIPKLFLYYFKNAIKMLNLV